MKIADVWLKIVPERPILIFQNPQLSACRQRLAESGSHLAGTTSFCRVDSRHDDQSKYYHGQRRSGCTGDRVPGQGTFCDGPNESLAASRLCQSENPNAPSEYPHKAGPEENPAVAPSNDRHGENATRNNRQKDQINPTPDFG